MGRNTHGGEGGEIADTLELRCGGQSEIWGVKKLVFCAGNGEKGENKKRLEKRGGGGRGSGGKTEQPHRKGLRLDRPTRTPFRKARNHKVR